MEFMLWGRHISYQVVSLSTASNKPAHRLYWGRIALQFHSKFKGTVPDIYLNGKKLPRQPSKRRKRNKYDQRTSHGVPNRLTPPFTCRGGWWDVEP